MPTKVININTINKIYLIIGYSMNETIITDKIIAGMVNKSPKAAIIGVDILSGSQPCSKLLIETNIVKGSITALEIIPPITEIKVKSAKLILSNPNTIHTALAMKPKNTDKITVKINEDDIFSDNSFEYLSSGVKEPIWRFVERREPRAPKMFPLISIAPGMRTNKPGKTVKYSSIFPSAIPAHKLPIEHIKRAVNDSLNIELVSLKKGLNLRPIE